MRCSGSAGAGQEGTHQGLGAGGLAVREAARGALCSAQTGTGTRGWVSGWHAHHMQVWLTVLLFKNPVNIMVKFINLSR